MEPMLMIFCGQELMNKWYKHVKRLERFEATRYDQPPFTFAVMHIKESQDILCIERNYYLNKKEQIPN